MEELDLVVVGAGWYGLAAAKQYREINPEHSIAIVDYASSIGGVWAEHRLYPGLKSNNLWGTYEYPDFPMDPSVFGIQPRQHPTGQALHAYLTAYAKKFGFFDNVHCGVCVLSAEHLEDGGWILTVRSVTNSDPQEPQGEESRMFARKLVLATGMTSEPFLPRIKGQADFDRPLFHIKDLLKYADATTSKSVRRMTVLGGSKSAWDAVYAYGRKGIPVDWVIRAITNTFWHVLGSDVITLNGYDSHPEMAKLKPWTSAMFTASTFSILNYDTDFLSSSVTAAFDSDDQITPDTALSPPLLYHFIAPVSPRFLRTRDFAFAGGIMNFSAAICAHIQGLWIAAYFDGKLVRDPTAGISTSGPSQRSEPASLSLEDIQYETILYNRFGRWRYPADHGAKFPDFVFDVVPYMDVMMADLGLQVHRKGGWFKEITDPYGPEDYVDINDEWRRKFAEK
ncbi:unnamed protein product [Parascedosporium putredinis]|uniref:FAD/NAD(P)-binding domain-containing protein n=1 Tax=Parascedosporium putredinis TaxID=1442378 RepID=A0A9P1H2C8_9PEZI|nr:unnamed protein product [Parascedosporium putredinis]CAI7994819.1 unnamed protein product [Parascedosporium putredinis]